MEYKWNEEKTNKHKEELNVLNKLSTNLKNELLLEANISVLNQVSFLRDKFSKGSLKKKIYIYLLLLI